METNCKPTQAQKVLAYIKENGFITPLEAIRDLGVMRLASRITDLKNMGYAIESENISVKTRDGKTHVKKYWLAEEQT